MCLAIPGEIIAIMGEGEGRRGKVRFGGVVRDVHLGFVPEARVGDYVNVHAGFAIAVIDAESARETLALWNSVAEKEASHRR